MTILILAAHPDDEILGCGGTVARLAAGGEEVQCVIFGEGIASRYAKPGKAVKGEIDALHKKSKKANTIIGVKETRFHDLPDNKFDSVPLLEIVKLVESAIDRCSPATIFTHHGGDLNIDHVLLFRAVMTAARPLKGSPVKEIYTFPVPSSTDWAFQNFSPVFKPNTFFDISGTLKTKIAALKEYDSEMRPSPHARSYENVENIARQWGEVTGTGAAEAFELVLKTV